MPYMNDTITDAMVVAVVMALVESIKRAGVPSRFAGLISAALGVAYGLATSPTPNVAFAVVRGLIIGLSASGLYSGTKALLAD